MTELNISVIYSFLFKSPILKLVHVKHGMCQGHYLVLNLWLLGIGIHKDRIGKLRFFYQLKEL